MRRSDKKKARPIHLLLFAGHRTDSPGRVPPRFPSEKKHLARTLLFEAVKQQLERHDTYKTIGMASAAPGADILSHQVCAELCIKTTLCLPMPSGIFARLAFQHADEWRTEFLNLQEKHDILILSDREGLPRWLQESGMNFWERGNRWVMKVASASDADRITLIAFWDGKEKGDDLGGTAHMVSLAEEAGSVHIHRIDPMRLLP